MYAEATLLALRESQDKLQLLIDHVPAAVAMFDREMRYVAVSRRWKEDYRLGDTDLIGQSHYDVFPELTEVWKAFHRRGLAGESLRSEEDRFVRSDGTEQWVRWELLPWHAADGSVGGIMLFSEDVTARRQIEENLKKALEEQRRARIAALNLMEDALTARRKAEESTATLRKLSLAVEQSPESIVITDLDARIEYVNEAFVQAYRLSAATK